MSSWFSTIEVPTLRHTLDLPEGKTAFRDAHDLLAKTHGIRAHEATARIRLAASVTPARASDPDRQTEIGETRLPILGAFQGRVNPSKLSSRASQGTICRMSPTTTLIFPTYRTPRQTAAQTPQS